MTFQSKDCEIKKAKNGELMGKVVKTHNNVNVFDDSRVRYYLSKTNQTWLWDRRLGHINLEGLIKISKIEVVRGSQRLSKPNSSICKSCQSGKQTRTHFKIKEFSTSKLMALVRNNIYGLT